MKYNLKSCTSILLLISMVSTSFSMRIVPPLQTSMQERKLSLETILRDDLHLPILKTLLTVPYRGFQIDVEKALSFASSWAKEDNKGTIQYLIQSLPIETENSTRLYMTYMRLLMKGRSDEAHLLRERRVILQFDDFHQQMAHEALLPDNTKLMHTRPAYANAVIEKVTEDSSALDTN